MYMCGWTDPEATLMFYHDDGEWISHLFVQPKDTLMEIWEGRRPGTEGALRDWPIDRADSSHDMCSHLERLLESSVRVHVRPGIDPRIDSIVMSALRSVIESASTLAPGQSASKIQPSHRRDAFAQIR